MLRANQAVRLGLRAATRNPELAFGKALLDVAGWLLSTLPSLLLLVLLARALGARGPLELLLSWALAARALSLPLLGALASAGLLSWLLVTVFWSGALPLLAADAELQARPPAGTFLRLVQRGVGRVLAAGTVASGLSLLVSSCCTLALLWALPLWLLRPSPALAVASAALFVTSLAGTLLVDLFARLVLLRAAVVGEGALASLVGAARLLGERLGSCLVVSVIFFGLDLVVLSSGSVLSTSFGSGSLDPRAQLLGVAPQLGLGLAGYAILAWLETGRQGALAALVAEAAGLLEVPDEPAAPPVPEQRQRYRIPEPWELRPPRVAVQPQRVEAAGDGPVIDALPLPEEPVIDALPLPEEPVIDALPVAEAEPAGAAPDGGAGSGAPPAA